MTKDQILVTFLYLTFNNYPEFKYLLVQICSLFKAQFKYLLPFLSTKIGLNHIVTPKRYFS